MAFLKKNRRIILLFIMFFGLFFTGQELYEILTHGIDRSKNVIVELSGLFCYFFLSVGAFWELFVRKRRNES